MKKCKFVIGVITLKYLEFIEVQPVKKERKESLECRRMHIWALKPESFQGPRPQLIGARYVGNFWPGKLGPLPLEQNLDPHLWVIYIENWNILFLLPT